MNPYKNLIMAAIVVAVTHTAWCAEKTTSVPPPFPGTASGGRSMEGSAFRHVHPLGAGQSHR